MRRKKLQSNAVSNPVKTPEQLAFENKWNSVPKVQNENSNNLPPLPLEPPILPSTSQLPPPESLQPNAALTAAAILFGNQINTRNNESFEKDDIEDFPTFDDRAVTFNRNSSIPGLESLDENMQEKSSKDENPDVIDLDHDEETEMLEDPNFKLLEVNENKSNIENSSFKKSIPSPDVPIPRFRSRVQRSMISIDNLLYEPNRSTRPDK